MEIKLPAFIEALNRDQAGNASVLDRYILNYQPLAPERYATSWRKDLENVINESVKSALRVALFGEDAKVSWADVLVELDRLKEVDEIAKTEDDYRRWPYL